MGTLQTMGWDTEVVDGLLEKNKYETPIYEP